MTRIVQLMVLVLSVGFISISGRTAEASVWEDHSSGTWTFAEATCEGASASASAGANGSGSATAFAWCSSDSGAPADFSDVVDPGAPIDDQATSLASLVGALSAGAAEGLPGIVDDIVSPPPGGGTAPVGTLPGAFAVDADGNATYSIPIDVPPGVAGMQPSLSLNYSSGGGDGLAGIGWGLSGLSSVARCQRTVLDDGYAAPVAFDGEDRLCLDGERLVLVSGQYGRDGAEYRTRRDSFRRVIGHGSLWDGDSWFQVYEGSGRIAEYGSRGDARTTFGPTNDPLPYVWSINRVEDRFSNYMEIDYNFGTESYSLTGDDGDLVRASFDHRPWRIRYTGNGDDLAPQRSVQFDYIERAPEQILEGWMSGARLRTSFLLSGIRTYGPGEELVHRYELTYSEDTITGRPRITEARMCAADGACMPATTFEWQLGTEAFEEYPKAFDKVPWPDAAGVPDFFDPRTLHMDVNGDGAQDLVFSELPNDGGFGVTPVWSIWLSRGAGDGPGPGAGLFQGIQTEVLGTYADRAGGRLDLGTKRPVVAIDHNNDSRDDILFLDQATPEDPIRKIKILESTGDNFTELTTGEDWDGGYIIDFATVDLNTDGLQDLLICRNPTENSNDGEWFYLLNEPEYGGLLAYERRRPIGQPCSYFDENLVLDADGDGTPDLLRVRGTDGNGEVLLDADRTPNYQVLDIDVGREIDGGARVRVWDSGLPRDILQRWRRDPLNGGKDAPTSGARLGADKILDVDGDGLQDILRYELLSGDGVDNLDAIRDGMVTEAPEPAGIRVYRNTGAGFLRGEVVAEFTEYASFGGQFLQATPIDYDGDGRVDLLIPPLPSPASPFRNLQVLQIRTGELKATGVQVQFTDFSPIPTLPIFDFDGDGLHDFGWLFANREWHLQRHAGERPDLMRSITNGLGEVTRMQYGTLTDSEFPSVAEYDQGTNCVYPQNCYIGPRFVVVNHSEDLGLDISARRNFLYDYDDGRRDRRGRGWLGFGDRRVIELIDGDVISITDEHYDNFTYDEDLRDYPYRGRVESVTRQTTLRDTGKLSISRQRYIYDTVVQDGSDEPYYFVYAQVSLDEEWEVPDSCEEPILGSGGARTPRFVPMPS